MWVYILGILLILSAAVAIQYRIDINNAYKRLNNYDIKTACSNFGKMSYIDEGTGEAILISHGIFGGYDQAYASLKSLVGDDFKSMFASEIDKSLYETMLPAAPRKKGIKIDESITNIDMDINFDDYEVEKITAPVLVVHAKDDPMAKYENTEKFIARTNAKTAVFETGGQLITGHGDAVSIAIKEFIE